MHIFKHSMALGPGLGIVKLLRMFSPPCRVMGAAKAADLLSQSHHPSALLLLSGNCYSSSVTHQWDLVLNLLELHCGRENGRRGEGAPGAVRGQWLAHGQLPRQQTPCPGGHPHGPGGW